MADTGALQSAEQVDSPEDDFNTVERDEQRYSVDEAVQKARDAMRTVTNVELNELKAEVDRNQLG